MARSANRAVIDGKPRLTASSFQICSLCYGSIARNTCGPRMVASSSLCTICEESPDHKHDHGADDRANEACSFTSMIPADRLAEESGDERPDNSQYRGQDEA